MTASPPPWLAAALPRDAAVARDGTRLWPGGRQQFCPVSPGLPRARRRARRASSADRYAGTRRWRCGTSATSTAATSPTATATPRAAAFRRLAARAVRRRRRPQRRLGHDVLVASATATSDEIAAAARARRPSSTPRSSSTSARFTLRRAAGLLPARARRSSGGSPRTCRSPRTSWAAASPIDSGSGRRGRRRRRRHLPRPADPRAAADARRSPTTSCGPRAAGSRGC